MARRAAKLSATGLALLAAGMVAPAAHAYEAEVDASTAAQFYSLSSPFDNGPTVDRRRFIQTLGLEVYDLQGDSLPLGPELSFHARVRLDADFGQQNSERDPTGAADQYVPGLDQAPFDVMYAYLEGRNYFGGYFGFKLGRQYIVDSLGWWSFDGGLVSLTTPVFFKVEAYGGFEQRGGLPLSTSRFEPDGIYRGDRTGLDYDEWPTYLEESALAPAYGFAIESSGVHFLHTRFTYRKVIDRDTVYATLIPDAGNGFTTVGGDRVSSERLGYSARLTDPSLGSLAGSVVYDLYNQLFSEYDASADWYATQRITLGADYDYFMPTFDADSIFNWFAHDAITRANAHASWKLTRQLDVAGSFGVELYRTDGDPYAYAEAVEGFSTAQPDTSTTSTMFDTVSTASGRYRWTSGSVSLHGTEQAGQTGHLAGGDLTTKKRFQGGLYDAMVDLSLYDWHDALRPTRDATSFTYVLGGGFSPFRQTRLGLEWEHSMNRLVGQRFRVLATLDMTVLR
jgi:hypothetical protein